MAGMTTGNAFPLFSPTPPLVLTEVGDYDGQDGARVILSGQLVLFQVYFEGQHVEIGMSAYRILDALQKQQES